MNRQMTLTTFLLPLGYHRNSWRLPGSRAEEVPGLDFVVSLAQMAERAKLDAVFFGDISHANGALRGDTMMNGFYEPMTVLSAIAARTSRIGLIGTISTSFTEPYNAARQLAALDHLSAGRAGWNVVTSTDGAANFGLAGMPDPVERYRRAGEYVEVVRALWDSWSDDAVIVDRESGRWLDPAKLRRIGFSGEFFSVEGPLTGPRPPQGHPVIVQAGSSGPGKALGSAVADAIYTAQPRLPEAVDFAKELRELVAEAGRRPGDVKILPGIVPVVADTAAEAEEIAASLGELLDYEQGRRQLAADLNAELGDIELDERIPAERIAPPQQLSSRQNIYRSKAVEGGLTLRELVLDRARSTGHQWIVGTAATVADRMQQWFAAGACDGFNLNAPHNPDGFERMCTKLVPELQDRGLFRTEYEGATLREHLGLPRPDVRF